MISHTFFFVSQLCKVDNYKQSNQNLLLKIGPIINNTNKYDFFNLTHRFHLRALVCTFYMNQILKYMKLFQPNDICFAVAIALLELTKILIQIKGLVV